MRRIFILFVLAALCSCSKNERLIYDLNMHLMIIELTGHDFWDGNYGNYGGANGIYYEMDYYIPYARKLYKIITENEIEDENGNIIQGWMVP